MTPKYNKLFLAVLGLVLTALACNMPRLAAAPTPFVFPTPNLTLTAVFSPPTAIQPTTTFPLPALETPTSLPGETASPTSSPTSTSVPDTFTPAPPTATSIPPSATPVPPTPTVSFAGPQARQAASLAAYYIQDEPRIDGNFEEWNLERYEISAVVAGIDNWEGASDLSGNFMLGWDDYYLYIAARVRDDRYAQNAVEANLYKGDSLEILFDRSVASDYYLDSLNGDDYQLGISPGYQEMNADPEAYLWKPRSLEGGRRKVKASTTPTDDGYRIEIKIPWETFEVRNPDKGDHYGFALSISDNDNPDRDVQQSMVSSISTRVYTNPTTWGDLVLVGAAPKPNPQTRPGSSVHAVYTTAPPAIDGNLGDWNLTAYSVNHVVYGADSWDGAADLSGTMMASWDDANLYLGVRVVDERFVQNASGENIFLGDSLEILFDRDVQGDFYDQNLSGDDYQIGVSSGRSSIGNDMEAYLWYPRGQAGALSQVKRAAAATSDGYIVEVALPWSVLSVSPAGGQHYGFALSISDNDNQNRDAQQSMTSNVPTRVLTDPTTWGDLTLTKP